MDREELIKELSQRNERKIVLVVLDGLGGAPNESGKTELEAARTPNLDKLAKISEIGLVHPISPGITPGSGPSHLALFGYDPIKYQIGRGVLENLGLGVELKKGDIAIRGNFCTVKEYNGRLIVVDRRAGRIPTEENRRLCSILQKNISKIEDVEIVFTPGMEHRFAIRLRGEGLFPYVGDTDPQKEGKEPLEPTATDPKGEKLARILKKMLYAAREILKEEQANYILLRGISALPNIPSMSEIFKLTPAAIATYPMYKGLAKLVGMEVLEVEGNSIEDEINTLKKYYEQFDFFYLHIKKTDSYGEDGDYYAKVKLIEEFDKKLPLIMELEPHVLVVTGDHSTPAILKSHSWHPNPFLLYSPFVRQSGIEEFSERSCAQGNLHIYNAVDAMILMLANALKLKKFGA